MCLQSEVKEEKVICVWVIKSIKEQRLQQRDIMNQLTIDRQIEKDVEDTYAEWRKKLKDTHKENDDDDSVMDLSTDEPLGYDNAARFRVFIYNKSTEPFKSTYLSLMVTCSSLKYIQSLLNESPAHELMDFMSNPMYTNAHTTSVVANPEGNPEVTSYISDKASHHISSPPANSTHNPIINPQHNSLQVKAKKLTQKSKKNMRRSTSRSLDSVRKVMRNNQISLFTKPSTNTDDLSDMELKLKLLNIMQLNKSYETHDTHQKLYNTLYDFVTLNQKAFNAQDVEPCFHKRSHDNQDPLNDHEGRHERKEEKTLVKPLFDHQEKLKLSNNLTVTMMQVNVQFLQQLQPEWSRFVTIVKQQHKLDDVSYHKLFDILKQYQNEVNELRSKKLAMIANPLALVTTAQSSQDQYNQTSRSHRSSAPSPKPSIPFRSQMTTRHKGKEIGKPITPSSETASEKDIDPKQAQRDKDMQKNLALIAKYFKKIYKPTNKNLRTSSPKRVKDSAYHKEKMLLCKQAEQGVPLQGEQYDWLTDMDEEVDEQELKAHYSYIVTPPNWPAAKYWVRGVLLHRSTTQDIY
nr:hypothetical protein [Tanacetum cinerariifolium]